MQPVYKLQCHVLDFEFKTSERIEKVNRIYGETFLNLCVSSLSKGHANLLCIIPILLDVSKETIEFMKSLNKSEL